MPGSSELEKVLRKRKRTSGPGRHYDRQPEPCHPHRKEASTCSDSAAAAGNFSASSSGGTLQHSPGRSEHKPAPPGPQVPGPADAPLGPAGATPGRTRRLSRAGRRQPAASPSPRGGRASEAPKPRPATPAPKDSPVPDGAGRGRCLEVPVPVPLPLRAQTWTGSAGRLGPGPSAALQPAGYLPRGRRGRRRSSPASAPASQGRKVKEKQRPPRPGRSRRPVRPPPAGGSAPAPRGHWAPAQEGATGLGAQGRCRPQGQLHPLSTAGARDWPRPGHAPGATPAGHARRPSLYAGAGPPRPPAAPAPVRHVALAKFYLSSSLHQSLPAVFLITMSGLVFLAVLKTTVSAEDESRCETVSWTASSPSQSHLGGQGDRDILGFGPYLKKNH